MFLFWLLHRKYCLFLMGYPLIIYNYFPPLPYSFHECRHKSTNSSIWNPMTGPQQRSRKLPPFLPFCYLFTSSFIFLLSVFLIFCSLVQPLPPTPPHHNHHLLFFLLHPLAWTGKRPTILYMICLLTWPPCSHLFQTNWFVTPSFSSCFLSLLYILFFSFSSLLVDVDLN